MGNTPIVFAGIEIGMMITRVPWLLPSCFEGLGVPLNIMQAGANKTTSQKPAGPLRQLEKKPVPPGLLQY